MTETVLSEHREIGRCTIAPWDCKACAIYDKIKSENKIISMANFSELTCDNDATIDTRNKILEHKIRILEKELNNDAKTLTKLAEENDNFSKGLMKLRKAKEKRLSEEKELERCIELKKDDIEAKKVKMNELWNVIKLLDDDNVNLKREAEESQKQEKHMKNEILRCQLALFANDPNTCNLYLSPDSNNWKNKLVSDSLNKTESLRKDSKKKRVNNQRISNACAAKKFIEKFLQKQEKLTRALEEKLEEDESFKFDKQNTLKAPQASSLLNQREDTSTYEFQRQDFVWCNQNENTMSDEKSTSENWKANIWEPFKNWNWKQEYLAEKRFTTYIDEKKVNPSLVPLKIIDDREERLAKSKSNEVITSNFEPNGEKSRRL